MTNCSLRSTTNHDQGKLAAAVLIVFARLPRLHHVKTRLAAGVGADNALELYCAALTQLLREAAKCDTCHHACCN